MMEKDNISIALECFDVKEEDMVKVAQAVRQINNVGFCVEHYHAVESVFPGTFKNIDVKKLSKKPSNTCRDVALEAIDLGAIGKIAGAAVVGGGIGYIIGKLIAWVSERFSGKGSSGGDLRVETQKMKEAISEMKRMEREVSKIDIKALDDAIEQTIAEINGVIDSNSKQAKVTAVSVMPKNVSVLDVEKAIKNSNNAYDPMIEAALFSPSGVKGVISFNEHPKYSVISKIEYVSLSRTLQDVFKLIIEGVSSGNVKLQKSNLEKVKRLTSVYMKHVNGFDEALTELKTHSLNAYSHYYRTNPQEFIDPSKGYLDKLTLENRWFKINEEACESIRKNMKGISQSTYKKVKKDTTFEDEEVKRGYDQIMKDVGMLTRYVVSVMQLKEGAIRQYNRIVKISERSNNKVVDILKHKKEGKD